MDLIIEIYRVKKFTRINSIALNPPPLLKFLDLPLGSEWIDVLEA